MVCNECGCNCAGWVENWFYKSVWTCTGYGDKFTIKPLGWLVIATSLFLVVALFYFSIEIFWIEQKK